ncbi:hypothetical protein MTO96_038921, partial [Rhipicephalus appendiculatus]
MKFFSSLFVSRHIVRSTESFHCGNQSITVERVCDFVKDCAKGEDEHNCGECDFTKDLCGWTGDGALNRSTTAWRRQALGEVENSPDTGVNDETTGTGMDVSLHMTANGYTFPVWTLGALSETPEEGLWHEAEIEIGRYRSEISVLTLARSQSLFAVDDIEYSQCALPEKQDKCENKEFRCANGACVEQYERCNFVDDCGDNSDEQDCGQFMVIQSTTTKTATVIGPTFDNSTFCAVAFIGEHTIDTQLGYIAIDDVHFSSSCTMKDGGLPSAPEPKTPPLTCGEKEFQCTGITQCVPLSKLCDFHEDCSNGADESRCGACEFTTDLCGLENVDSDARYGWNWTSVEDGKKIKGFPLTGGRSNTQGGYAAYSLLNTEAPESGRAHGLATPALGPIAHSCVVTFYAYIPENSVGGLNFAVKPPQTFSSERSHLKFLAEVSAGRQKDQWRKISLHVGNWDAGARFVYLASSLGVSIDRPEYSMCHPDSQSEESEAFKKVSCSFSNPSNCGWFPEQKAADTPWTLDAGGEEFPTSKWQPFDSESHKGPYKYAQNRHSVISKAHLVSIKMSPTPDTGRCFTFWYNMWHPNVGHLNLMKRVDNGTNSLLWTRSSPQGKEWKQGQVQLFSDAPHQIHTNQASLIMLGGFALVKSPGGRMVSPESWYDATEPKCFRFWFFLAGTSTEKLTVAEQPTDRQEVPLWSGTPPKDNSRYWRQASITIQANKKTPTVIFDATSSESAGAVVAVDDISLGSGPCPSPGSCSFEEDMCGWTSTTMKNNAHWYRHRGATVLNTTGVQEDHTLGTTKGYYLLLDAGDLASHGYGSLQSQMFSLGPSACISLYYSMKKDSGALLIVGFFNETGASLGHPQTAQASTTGEWTRLSIERSDLPTVFSVIISGETAHGQSDILIDDIDVRRGKCGETAFTTVVPTPEPPMVPTEVLTSETVPSETPEPVPSETPEPVPSETPEPVPSETPEPVPSETPEPVPSETPEPVPSETPEPVPSETPAPVTTETPAPPEPKPAVVCRRDEFSCRDGSTCIPSALLCDGVKDCPNGLDENC